MKSPSPPPAPDPNAMIAAQTAASTAAAKTQQQMNMINQTNPYGSVNYTETGTWSDGTPKFSSNTTLSPQEMQKQQQQWKFDDLVNKLGISQTEKLSGHLDTPITLDNEATEARLMELGSKRLDPMFAQRREEIGRASCRARR